MPSLCQLEGKRRRTREKKWNKGIVVCTYHQLSNDKNYYEVTNYHHSYFFLFLSCFVTNFNSLVQVFQRFNRMISMNLLFWERRWTIAWNFSDRGYTVSPPHGGRTKGGQTGWPRGTKQPGLTARGTSSRSWWRRGGVTRQIFGISGRFGKDFFHSWFFFLCLFILSTSQSLETTSGSPFSTSSIAASVSNPVGRRFFCSNVPLELE